MTASEMERDLLRLSERIREAKRSTNGLETTTVADLKQRYVLLHARWMGQKAKERQMRMGS